MTDPAPFCKRTMGGGLHCYRRTRDASGYCPQHRPGRTGRGELPLSQRPMHDQASKAEAPMFEHEMKGEPAAGKSINEELAELPKQRAHAASARGLVLLLPRTGHIVVPFDHHRDWWACVVVRGDDIYPVGGHHLYVSDDEILTGIEAELPRASEVDRSPVDGA